jgi:hypothetical protein
MHHFRVCSARLAELFNGRMGELLVIQSLKEKRAEILGRVAAYEAQIAAAKHDLAHVNATIRLFTEPEKQRARYMASHGFFRKGRSLTSAHAISRWTAR